MNLTVRRVTTRDVASTLEQAAWTGSGNEIDRCGEWLNFFDNEVT
jgi:hypothetical protein